MKPNLRSVEVTQVIHIMTLEGQGLPNDLAREVHRYYAPDGEFLAENDPHPPKEKEAIDIGGIDIQEIRKDERERCQKIISDLADEAMRANKDYEDLNKAYCRIQAPGVSTDKILVVPDQELDAVIRKEERQKCIDELEKERDGLEDGDIWLTGMTHAITRLHKNKPEHADENGKPTQE